MYRQSNGQRPTKTRNVALNSIEMRALTDFYFYFVLQTFCLSVFFCILHIGTNIKWPSAVHLDIECGAVAGVFWI